MSESALLERAKALTPSQAADVAALAAAAQSVDGAAPLNEAALLRLNSGPHGATSHLLLHEGTELLGYAGTTKVGASTQAELVVSPAHRRQGHGRRLLLALIEAQEATPLHMWAHGDLPAAVALAEAYGFTPVRELRRLHRSLRSDLPEVMLPPGVRLRAFVPGQDDDAWLALNARAFADHPEQGQWTDADLSARLALPDFDPAGFLVAESADELLGFHWTKVHTDGTGEVYVLGVDPGAQGGGLGRALLLAGLQHLQRIGVPEVLLYVEASSPALAMYERAGFSLAATDVLYARRQS